MSINCKKEFCKHNIYTDGDFKRWSTISGHPDKGGSTKYYQYMLNCREKKSYCPKSIPKPISKPVPKPVPKPSQNPKDWSPKYIAMLRRRRENRLAKEKEWNIKIVKAQSNTDYKDIPTVSYEDFMKQQSCPSYCNNKQTEELRKSCCDRFTSYFSYSSPRRRKSVRRKSVRRRKI